MYDQCPRCGDVHITLFEATLENNEIIYRCYACDWMKVKTAPFHLGVWIIRVSQALAPIDIFQSLLTDKDVVGFLRPRLKGESYLGNQRVLERNDEYLRGEIDIAHQVYLRQMIVLAATYIELILKEFFLSFSVANPSLLIKCLAKDKNFQQKAMTTVTFDKIMRGEAKEELIKRSFDLIGEKEYRRLVSDLAEHAPIKLNHKEIFNKIRSLNDQRNDIVHHNLYDEIDDKGIDVQQVYDSFKLINDLLYVLAKIAEKNDIPYWIGFLYEFECELDGS